jgi:hypothetical protein
MRKASRTKVDDVVTVEQTFDEQYRNGPLHPYRRGCKRCSKVTAPRPRIGETSRPVEKEVPRYFSALKSPEAKARNVERIVKIQGANRIPAQSD